MVLELIIYFANSPMLSNLQRQLALALKHIVLFQLISTYPVVHSPHVLEPSMLKQAYLPDDRFFHFVCVHLLTFVTFHDVLLYLVGTFRRLISAQLSLFLCVCVFC